MGVIVFVFETTIYSKPTDSHLYLEASSCHEKSFKNDIIKGVALHLHRICSTKEDYKMKLSEYKGYLVARVHFAKLVKSEFDKVSLIPRHEAREKVEKSFENEVTFTSTFNPRSPNLSQIIICHLHLIKNSQFLHKIFPDGSILVANKRC